MTNTTEPLVAVSEATKLVDAYERHCPCEEPENAAAERALLIDFAEYHLASISHHAGMREALEQAAQWHEEQDKAISKQPRANEGDNGWRRLQHQEQIANIRTVLASLQTPQDGWQPIETAPKDATCDLWVRNLFGGAEYRLADCWHDGTDWLDRNDERIIETVLAWMPLPAPPAALTSQGGEHGKG